MSDTLEINLAGRIMLGASRHGLSDPARVHEFVRAIVAVIDHHHPDGRPGLKAPEPLITEQLQLLEAALVDARLRRQLSAGMAPPVQPVDEVAAGVEDDAEAVAEDRPRIRQRVLKGKGHTVVAKAMEEKLRDERAPVQQLLLEDCVHLGLLDKKQAQRLVRSMVGRSPEEGEQQVVEQLRQILQDQVKGIIRRLKGGPWATPQQQEDMRQDIHNARSVRSILMLARQIIKERREWEKRNGKGGMFGNWFGARKGLA